MSWSTRADVVATLRRRWDRGEFLTELVEGRQWEPLDLALRGPTARNLADRFGEVRTWVDRWRAGLPLYRTARPHPDPGTSHRHMDGQ
ncbi:MAG: hypothetical protein JO115_07675 [Pseudonocardiales bacterium]|nr:hypothetical protein [Pseudonocardiales bacterium]